MSRSLPSADFRRFPAVVLAAGASTRLGRPKQLLLWNGKTLLRRAAESAFNAGCSPVTVVLGAQPLAASELADLPISIVHATDWAAGMGASLHAGVSALPPDAAGVLITLCDQPRVDGGVLRRLLSAHRPGAITASAYGDSVGVPAAFDRAFFPALLSLPPQAGAQRLLAAHAANVLRVPTPEALSDIDTPADYDRLAAEDGLP